MAAETVSAEPRTFMRFPARMVDWTPKHRTYAARMAVWYRERRRSPEGIIQARYDALVKTTEPRILRLVACDVAEAVLPLWQATYPEDPRVAACIFTSRRYAEGLASDGERLAASRLAVFVCQDMEARSGLDCPATGAAEAAGFTLWKRAADALQWADQWATHAKAGRWVSDPGKSERLIALIEARLG